MYFYQIYKILRFVMVNENFITHTTVEIIYHVLSLFTPLKLHCNSDYIIFLPSYKS
jgi:hypothetical protein